jgi:hypothetical protein
MSSAAPESRISTGWCARAGSSMRLTLSVDDQCATIHATDASSGDEGGARPLMQGRARITFRQAKRAADESAETGIEQAAPVDLEISRHRDC